MVEHGDCECRFCYCEGGALNLFGESASLKNSGLARNLPRLPRPDPGIIHTNFIADDAVFGDEAKVLQALDSAAEKAGPRGLVEFYSGCSPIMLATDIAAAARSVERGKGVKIVLEHFNSFYDHAPAKTSVRVSFMAHKLSRAARKPSRDVHLANFRFSTDTLRELLAERGISAVEPGKDFYAGAASARLQVLSGPDTVLGPAFDSAGLKRIQPPAPYGFAGTAAWLKAITAALHRKNAPAGPSAAQKGAARELWRRAGGFTAGFVLAPEEIGLLSGSAALKMVPVLPVLAEAGFRVRLFVMAGDAGAAAKIAPRFAALKTALPGLRLSAKVFSAPEELEGLLRSDRGLRLVYSDIRRDARAVSAGKSPFSTAIFEPGYEGALETWRRLLELCEWEFNERYLRHD